MDFVKIILNCPDSKLCTICFKQKVALESITKKFCICYENSDTFPSVHDMLKYLFPSHELLTQDICSACIDVILSMYVTLKRHEANKKKISIIIDHLLNHTEKDVQITNESKKLHIELPRFDVTESKSYGRKTGGSGHIFDEALPSQEFQGQEESSVKKQNQTLLRKLDKNEATVCEICGKECKKPNALKAHLNCHNEKNCPYCFKILKTHSHFKIHVKSHEGIKKIRKKDSKFYYCNDCDYRTLNKSSLQAHINKYHLCERPFVCEICSKGFYKKSNLTEHILIHENTKNLTCEQCGDNFVCKKTLTEHLRLHTGEKPFRCNVCDASFVTSGRRLDHFKRKHGDKNECCTVCGKKYSLKKDLNWHMKMVHDKNMNSSETLLVTNYEFVDDNGDVLPVLSSI